MSAGQAPSAPGRALLAGGAPALLGFALSLAVLLLLGRAHLGAAVYPEGDLAADMLLTDMIRAQGYLLTGHYSRFQFHHPGPFFFYVNYLAETALSWLFPGRYAVWTFTAAVLDALFLAVAAWLVGQNLPRPARSAAALAFTALVLLAVWQHALALWMPYKLVLPYLAFLLTLPLLWRRQFAYLWLSVLLCCILIHGYVTLPLFTLPLLLIAVAGGLYRHAAPAGAREGRYFASGAALALLFALPMALDGLLNEPGNLHNILAAADHARGLESATWPETWALVRGYWDMSLGLWQALPAAVGLLLLLRARQRERQAHFAALLLVSLLVTLLFLAYYKTAPGPLLDFMGMFYRGVPVLLLSLATTYGIVSLRPEIQRALTVGLCAVPLYAAYSAPLGAPAPNREIGALAEAVARLTQGGPGARLGYTRHEMWPLLAGVLLELRGRGENACTTWRHMGFLYTPPALCEYGLVSNLKLVDGGQCGAACLARVGDYGLLRPPGALAEGGIPRFSFDTGMLVVPALDIPGYGVYRVKMRLAPAPGVELSRLVLTEIAAGADLGMRVAQFVPASGRLSLSIVEIEGAYAQAVFQLESGSGPPAFRLAAFTHLE